MKKVITYGTYDHLHQGHINLLKRAKALGDYLIVGVTTENFDINRGKINVQQSLMERIESVKALGIADEVFPEEYVGQKIEDIKEEALKMKTATEEEKKEIQIRIESDKFFIDSLEKSMPIYNQVLNALEQKNILEKKLGIASLEEREERKV